jgi:hypothetical protein
MNQNSEPRFEDAASGEEWFQKGVTLLEGRKQERELEGKLRRKMAHSIMYEWQFWVGMMWVLMVFFGTNDALRFLGTISAVVAFALAIDGAAAKRTQGMLDWIEYDKARDKPSSIDSQPLAS